jgi:exosortase/archaeosortase family protein
LAAINALAGTIIAAFVHAPLIGVVANLAGISAVIWFAIWAALKIGWDAPADRFRRWDMPVLLLVVATAMVPVSDAARAGLVICAFYAFATTRAGEPGRRVALLLVALTGTLVWGPLLLNVFSRPLLALDAHIVGGTIGSAVHGNVVATVDRADLMVVGKACSSIHNISLAIVLWCTTVALFDLPLDRRLVTFGGAMVGLMFALNIARLCAIGLFPADYEFLHMGTGAALFGWAGLMGIGMLAVLGAHDALARRS